jgi:nucleolar protein 4
MKSSHYLNVKNVNSKKNCKTLNHHFLQYKTIMSEEIVEKKTYAKKVTNKESSEDPLAKLTLFVRGLPFEATSKDLEDFFGEIGPIRKCFVVTDRSIAPIEGQPPKNKGFGYVHYALEEDAQSAISKLKNVKFQGRKLKIELAKRKSETVREDTRKEAVVAAPVSADTEPKKPSEPLNFDVNARLIVRNLPWKYREADLRTLFEKYGKVHDIKLPRKYEGGPLRGFAFIQFEKVDEGKAVSNCNFCKKIIILTGLFIRVVRQWKQSMLLNIMEEQLL